MHDRQLKDRFIEFRIEGKSRRGISEELKISKNTACEWNIEFGARIVEAQRIAMETAMEEHLAGPVARVQNIALIYSKTLERIMDNHKRYPHDSINFDSLLKLDSHLRKIMPALPRQPHRAAEPAPKPEPSNPA